MHHAAPAGKPTGTRHFSRVAPGVCSPIVRICRVRGGISRPPAPTGPRGLVPQQCRRQPVLVQLPEL